MNETKRVNRFRALATATYMRELADHGALTPEESSWLMGARDVIGALVGERDAAEDRAAPSDGPVVTLLRNDVGNTLYALDASDSMGRWQALPSPIAAMLIPALGLAPGACQRFRLAPILEGE